VVSETYCKVTVRISSNIMFKGIVCSFYGSMFTCDRKAESSNFPDLLLAKDIGIAEEDKEQLDIYHHIIR
jgi:hypothetical protein